MIRKRKAECTSLVVPDNPGTPLEELEERLEMQRAPLPDASLACYTDLCPGDCGTYCPGGYTGCTDKCLCDGTMCTVECGALCAVDACVVDFLA
jgi:hypothetical protein